MNNDSEDVNREPGGDGLFQQVSEAVLAALGAEPLSGGKYTADDVFRAVKRMIDEQGDPLEIGQKIVSATQGGDSIALENALREFEGYLQGQVDHASVA
jgi:hypothetical protein